jgi:transglutaminase-like putative cysteine protease
MNKKIVFFAILVILSLFIIAPFTFRDQIQNFLSLFSSDSEQKENLDPDFDLANTSISRMFDETSCALFITPNDPTVIALRDEILQDNIALLTPDWMAIRDWVGNSIQYVSDSEIHSEREFWQFSNETIHLETGDCEDFSILLCSLLRSNGWDYNSVHVIIGAQNNQHHAWVRLEWEGRTYNIEPQGSGFDLIIGDNLNLSGFEAIYFFNDQEFGSV